METFNAISRFAVYYARHGLSATICRGAQAVRRGLLSNRMVVFYCDLLKQGALPSDLPKSVEVERLRSYAELDPGDLHQIVQVWNPDLVYRNIGQRFEQGASLWLIKSGGRLAGYSWTLLGRTMVPYYLPLGEHDVHLFDFYVFPRFRGRAMIHLLVIYILRMLAADGAVRVFGEVAEWNRASLSCYVTMPFQRLGLARRVTILGFTIVCWAEDGTVRPVGTGSRKQISQQQATTGNL